MVQRSVPQKILAEKYPAPSFPCHFHLCQVSCFTPTNYHGISHSIFALIYPTMVGEGKRPYAVDKLYQNNLEQNVHGRKKAHGLTYTVTTTPKRLKDGFTNKIDTKKKSSPAPSVQHATRSSTAAADAEALVSSTKSVYDGNTPFTSAKKKGRKRKANQEELSISPLSPSFSPISQTATKYTSNASMVNYRLRAASVSPVPTSVSPSPPFADATATPASALPPKSLPSIRDRGLRRLLPDDIMELQANDEVVIVVPIDKPRIEGGVVRGNRSNIKSRLKKRLINAELSRYAGLSNEQKDTLFDNTIRERHVVQRDGEWFTEFYGTITKFPNREEYKTWSEADVDLHMSQNGSFSILFFGYEDLGRTVREFEVRLDELASVEVWKRRDAEEGFNAFIQFDAGVIDSEKMGKQLVEMLSLVEGDVASSLEVLYKFYRRKSDGLVRRLRKAQDKVASGVVQSQKDET